MPQLIESFRAAAFDLDGTLVDTAPDLAAAANATLEALGYAPLATRQIESLIGAGVERMVWGSLAESAGRTPEPATVATATALFRRRYAECLFERSRVYPGVIEGLQALDALGIKLCCVTNKHSAFTLPLLKTAGLAARFAFALCADRPEERKPAPDLLIAASERLGVEPDQMLYVGDSRVDIAAARAARCSVAVVDYGYNGGHSLADEHPDWIIGSVAELLALPSEKRFANTEA
jgi:phosphoglycolate phosphatase